MTGYRTVMICCDTDRCTAMVDGRLGQPANEVRREIAKQGWTTRRVRSGSMADYYRADYCPEHST